jgi:hypothetical protein
MTMDAIKDIKYKLDEIIEKLEIPYSIEELVDNFNKVYYSFDTERKRFKIVGNKHYITYDEKKQKQMVKQKKVQIFLLKKHKLDEMNANDLKAMYMEVIDFCFYIELLKMYQKIDNKESILEEKYSSIKDEEIQNFLNNN